MNQNLLNELGRNADTFIGGESLIERIAAGKRLRVKLGVDPTRPDLTFGHMVVLNKLRQFQAMGHEAVLIIGDYTAAIGDPSGRDSTRPVLSHAQIEQNAASYLDQVFMILDRERTSVYRNSEWLAKMHFDDVLALARQMTVAQMLERDDFAKRYTEKNPISLVEFLYPLMQGYDSVMVRADVELGGRDQLFNLIVGRTLQRNAGQPEQAVLTLPLLVGLDGVKKMSKSYDNYISFNHSAADMLGKVMSVSDDTMWTYYRLLLEKDADAITRLKAGHPMDAKKSLAAALVGRFHSLEAARQELSNWEKVHSAREIPDEMPAFSWAEKLPEPEASLVDIAAASGLFPSKKEVRRLIEQGAVRVNDERRDNPAERLSAPAEGQSLVIQSGRRVFFRVTP